MPGSEHMPQRALEIGTRELNALLREGSGPLLVYVWAPWCPPCKVMTPAMDEVAARLEHKMRVLKLNAASEPQALTTFDIVSVPTLLLFSGDGREQARFLGALSSRAVIEWVSNNDGHRRED